MLLLKYLLLITAAGLFVSGAVIVAYDLYLAGARLKALARGAERIPPERAIRWASGAKPAAIALVPLFLGLSIAVVPGGKAGVAVSQISGVIPGTLYPGVHGVLPFVESIALYDTRDHVYTTAGAGDDAKKKTDLLTVQSKEGLPVGLAVAVRYRLDPRRLDYIHANVPQPFDEELVPPVVASAFRQVVPNYLVREVFATGREEMRMRAAEAITRTLAVDGIVVKEVMVRDVVLPPEYAKGLEGLLLKEQENERMGVEVELKQKEVRTAELEAEADKVRHVKEAEGEAEIVVLQAKAQADAMQHTLPLKEKQIEQSRLEAEARKEATVKNAEALAEAKVIDSKAEFERRNLMSDADAQHIRIVAAADAERMKSEGQALKQSPLIIQKIIADKLSDKVQIMMVPADGKFFFANDVLRGPSLAAATKAVNEDDDPR
jgi:regulator of protease activity HflC (stomatin/prohibitin superfamily)